MNVHVAWPTGLGAVLALIVLVVVIVLALIGQMPPLMAVLLGLLAVARLC
jgi:hypothetical protein